MCYSHSSAWLISRCPILAWLPSAQLIFLHCKSAFPRAEFSSIHDVLNPVSRAQHFTRQSRLAQRSPRSARAGAGCWSMAIPSSRCFAVSWLVANICHRLFWLGSLWFISTDAVTRQSPRALPFLLLLLFLSASSGTGSDMSTQITGYQLPIAQFCYLCSASIAL